MNVNGVWLCPACISAELPYANVSLISDANTSVSSWPPVTSCPDSNYPSPFEVNSCTQLVCHLNCQSLLPKMAKMNEVRDILSNAMRPVILGISESWLDSSVAIMRLTFHLMCSIVETEVAEVAVSLSMLLVAVVLGEGMTWKMTQLKLSGLKSD